MMDEQGNKRGRAIQANDELCLNMERAKKRSCHNSSVSTSFATIKKLSQKELQPIFPDKKNIRRSLQHFDLPLQRWTLYTLTCKLLITGHYPVQKRGGNFFPLFAPLGFNSLGGESLPLQRKGGSPSRRDFRGEEEEEENQKVSGDRKGHFSFFFPQPFSSFPFLPPLA